MAPNVEEVAEREPPPYDPTMELLLNWQKRSRGKPITAQAVDQSSGAELMKTSSTLIPQSLDTGLLSIPENKAATAMSLSGSNQQGSSPNSSSAQSRDPPEMDARKLDATIPLCGDPAMPQDYLAEKTDYTRCRNDSGGMEVQEQHVPFHRTISSEQTPELPSGTGAISPTTPSALTSCSAQMTEPQIEPSTVNDVEYPCAAELACDQSSASESYGVATADTEPVRDSHKISAAACSTSKLDSDSAPPLHARRISSPMAQRGRGRWSWLAYHATRGDMRQYTDRQDQERSR